MMVITDNACILERGSNRKEYSKNLLSTNATERMPKIDAFSPDGSGLRNLFATTLGFSWFAFFHSIPVNEKLKMSVKDTTKELSLIYTEEYATVVLRQVGSLWDGTAAFYDTADIKSKKKSFEIKFMAAASYPLIPKTSSDNASEDSSRNHTQITYPEQGEGGYLTDGLIS